jgi:hypothetical protein
VGPFKFTSPAIGNFSEEYTLSWVAKSAFNVTKFRVVVTSRLADSQLTEVEVPPEEHSGNLSNWNDVAF